jgi:hypothetical protein
MTHVGQAGGTGRWRGVLFFFWSVTISSMLPSRSVAFVTSVPKTNYPIGGALRVKYFSMQSLPQSAVSYQDRLLE